MSNKEHTCEEQLSELVEAYDLDGLVKFSKQLPDEGEPAWHKQVMDSGFMALYSYCSYDQMCGKLGDGGLDFLDAVVEAAETFHGSPLRKLRAEVLSYRFEEIKETDIRQASTFALQAVDELTHEIPADPSAWRFRAHNYHELAQLDEATALHYWQLAVDDLASSPDFNLRILYHAWPLSIRGMQQAQRHARQEFHARINKALSANPDLLWQLLDEGIRLSEYQPEPELDKQISIWLQAGLSWSGDDTQPMLLRQAGLILHKQGKIRQQPLYFAKAIECFELFIMKDRAHAMEVNYMANVFEDWASLNEAQGYSGIGYLAKAWEAYREHEQILRINFSPLLHYAEFLERLYFNDQLTVRPDEEKILSLAVEAEVMGNGYYSGPGMIQSRMAIRNDDSETAIYHLCRLLLRHELCIDTLIKNLLESLTAKAPPAVVDFLNEAVKFMDEVSPGYYYDPKFSMAELNEMSRAATVSAWQARMIEVKNRSPKLPNS